MKADKPTPASIERKFRKYLGAVNPYLVLIEIATKEFKLKKETSIKDVAEKHGHYNLHYNHLSLDKLDMFVHLSHLAFIGSRNDLLCEDIINFCSMESFNFNKLGRMDALRKMVSCIHIFNSIDKEHEKQNIKLSLNSNPRDNTIFIDYIGEVDLKIVDYYRKIRNAEIHGGLEEKWEENDNLTELCKNKIEEVYDFRPSEFNDLTSEDVILYSIALQKIAKKLCSKLTGIEYLKSEVLPQLLNNKSNRRNTSITNHLREVYLQSDDIIDRLKSEVAW